MALVDYRETGKRSWFNDDPPTLYVVRGRAFVVLERKIDGDAVVVSVDTNAETRVLVAGE